MESLVTRITNIKNDPASINEEANNKTRYQNTFNEDTNKITSDYR